MSLDSVHTFTTIETFRDRFPAHAVTVLARLDGRVRAYEQLVYQSPVWKTLMDPRTSDDVFCAVLREVFTAVAAYQPHTTEAGFAMLGRLPKGDQSLLRALFNHKIEEAEHGLWALEDQAALGGPRAFRPAHLTPAAMAVVSVWWHMARHEEPIGYLGAEYLFEMLTPLLCPAVIAEIDRRNLPREPFRFLIEHAIEDIKHSNLMKILICEYLTRYPEASEATLRCFDYFAQVYPLPVWDEALQRAFITDPV